MMADPSNRAKISIEGWAVIYELINEGIPRKAIALEFGIRYDHLNDRISQLEREGII